MNLKDEIFVKIFENKSLKPDELPKIKEIKTFYTIEDFLKFLDNNRNELISVYTAECFLDWS